MKDAGIPPEFRKEPRGGKRQTQQEVRASTEKAQVVFLAEYATTGHITRSAKKAGINPETYYAWMKDPEFVLRVAAAREELIQSADAELLRRGLRPSEKDTRALATWLRAHNPALYGDKTKIQLVGNEEMIREIAEMIAQIVTDPATYTRLREGLQRIASA